MNIQITQKLLCRTEYIINNHNHMKNILTQGILPGIASTIHNTNLILYKVKKLIINILILVVIDPIKILLKS